jgi:integrase
MSSDRLFRRGKVWYAWYFDAEGARHQRSTKCTDKRAAEAVLREWERRAADPAYAAANSTTLEDALRRFLVDRKLKGRAEGTLESYRDKAGHLLRIVGAETPLARIDAQAVDRFIDTRLEEGAAANTVHKELTVLRGTLKVAKRRGEYTRDVAEVMPTGFSMDYQPRERFLTGAELQRLLAELTPDRAARVAFIVATGARWGESERARREDIDTTKGLVALRGTKTKRARRMVPLAGAGFDLIEHVQRCAEGTEGQLFRGWGNARRDLDAACKRAQIAKVSPNDLRRTYATWLRQAAVEPHLIGSAMGHADSRMVERVYGRMPVESLALALRWRVDGQRAPVPRTAPTPPKPTGNACSACVADACISPASEAPQALAVTPVSARFVVSGDGIEPPTRGFSILCSTD